MELRNKWQAIDKEHQQLMSGRVVAIMNRLSRSPYSVQITMLKVLGKGAEGKSSGLTQWLDNLTNLTNSLKGPLLTTAPLEIQGSRDRDRQNESHTSVTTVTTSSMAHPNTDPQLQSTHTTPCTACTNTGNIYPSRNDAGMRQTPPPLSIDDHLFKRPKPLL